MENADAYEEGEEYGEHEGLASRFPETEDLIKLCSALNEQGTEYIIIGGIAIIELGFDRLTGDIDILIESSRQNQDKARKALDILPDQAVRLLSEDDLDTYIVVRVADEVVVDLMLKACSIDFEEARTDIVWKVKDGVQIPFANARLLWKTKQTVRDKDAMDRAFLRRLLPP